MAASSFPGDAVRQFAAGVARLARRPGSTVDILLGQLAAREHELTRWAFLGGDHTFRGVLADALDEEDRPEEAELLRQHNRHVLVHTPVTPGKRVIVLPARFSPERLGNAFRAAQRQVDRMTDGYANYLPQRLRPVRGRPGVVAVDNPHEEDPEPPTFHHVTDARRLAADTVAGIAGLDTSRPDWPPFHPPNEDWAELQRHARHIRDLNLSVLDESHPLFAAIARRHEFR